MAKAFLTCTFVADLEHWYLDERELTFHDILTDQQNSKNPLIVIG